MNRLILIGNGFDLAHGLNTSYNDFIKWYMNRFYVKALKEPYKDVLLEIVRNSKYNNNHLTESNVNYWVQRSYETGFNNILLLGDPYPDYYDHRVKIYPFTANLKSELLNQLLFKCLAGRWVDIESIFYEQLKIILNGKSNDETKEILLKVLNDSLRCIVTQLEQYLVSLPEPSKNERYVEIFTSMIKIYDLHLNKMEKQLLALKKDQYPKHTYILNFNYTNTIEKYVTAEALKPPNKFAINYIHGKLKDELTPMIFGFGDELDEAYIKMEREQAKGYFEHIKSFWYFRNSRYKDLVRFTDNDLYQVCIIGHSCGLSDRTMLNMIFEHKNCKSIKIYYHGDDNASNYTDLTYDISRHFKDKAEMRNKIVSLDCSESMPQVI